jgi:hypothetical protein
MGVQIDEARRDDMAGHLAHIRARIRPQLASDRSYLATGKGDIGYGIESLRGVDHPAAAENQIEGHRHSTDIKLSFSREGGESSTPRFLRSTSPVSKILERPPEPAIGRRFAPTR